MCAKPLIEIDDTSSVPKTFASRMILFFASALRVRHAPAALLPPAPSQTNCISEGISLFDISFRDYSLPLLLFFLLVLLFTTDFIYCIV